MTLTGIRSTADFSPPELRQATVEPRLRPGPEPEQSQPEVRQADLDRALDQLNRTAQIFNTNLEFSTHEATGRILVRVLDTDTGQVVREIPPQKLLDAAASIQAALGLIFDARA